MRIAKVPGAITAAFAVVAANARCLGHFSYDDLSQVGTGVNPLAAPLKAVIDAENALGQLESYSFYTGTLALWGVKNTSTNQYVGFVYGYKVGANDPPGAVGEYLMINLDVPIGIAS